MLTPTGMSPMRSARYFLAAIALLVVVVGAHAVTTARRSQAELAAQLGDRGLALARTVEVASRHAIRSNALLEEMIARRLTDNAHLVDELLRRSPAAPELGRIVERNRLRRVDLLDRQGRPWTPPAPPDMPMMAPHMGMVRPGMMGARGDGAAPGGEPPMMRFMWGQRWATPGPAEAAPAAIQDRKFWEGTVFGVVVGATAFPGMIAVHADADFILNFGREIGVERQVAELAAQPGVAAVAVLGPDLTILAHSDPRRVGQRLDEPALARAMAEGRPATRVIGAGSPVLQVAQPLALDGARLGLLTLDLSTAPMEQAWREDVRAGAVTGVAVLLSGGLGLALIFYLQQRHLRDVQALQAEMARRERLAALGDVAAAFAHEVRNPLNAVSVGLQRLRAEFTPEPAAEYGRFVDLMQGEVRRLNAIVEQFIGLARPLPLRPGRVAPHDLLRDLAALVEGQSRAAGVRVLVDAEPGLPELQADRDRLRQVLLNLVLNAVQAMTDGGTVTLGATADRAAVVLTVTDDGPGIPPDVLPRIFDPYFSTRKDGLGLGLTIGRRIVEAHGGTIEVESRPGRTAFHLRLPRCAP